MPCEKVAGWPPIRFRRHRPKYRSPYNLTSNYSSLMPRERFSIAFSFYLSLSLSLSSRSHAPLSLSLSLSLSGSLFGVSRSQLEPSDNFIAVTGHSPAANREREKERERERERAQWIGTEPLKTRNCRFSAPADD